MAEAQLADSFLCSFIVLASTTDLARKVLNSSTAAEPCLVRSAKQVLLRRSNSLLPLLGTRLTVGMYS